MSSTAEADPLDDLGHVGRGAVSLVGSQAISWIFAAITITVVPRYLGDVGVGQIAVAASVWSIASIILSFGSGSLLTRETARDVTAGNELLARVMPMHVLALFVVAPVVALYAYVSGFDSTEVRVLVVVGAMSFAYALTEALIATLQGRGRIAIGALVHVVARGLAAVATVLVVLFVDQNVELIAAAGALGGLVALIGATVVVVRDPHLKLGLERRGYADVLKACWGFLILGGMATLYREIDVITIAALADEAAVGWYAQTDRLFGTMLIIPASLGAALLPVLSRRWVEDEEATLDIVRRSASTMLILVLPVAAGCIALGDEIAVTLFGNDFERSGLVLKVYAVVLLPVSFTILLGTMCIVMGRERLWSLVMLAMAIATIPLDLVLVPWADRVLDNAAVAGAIAFVITETGALVFGARRVVPGIIQRASLGPIAKATVAAAVMGVAAWFLRTQPLVVPVAVGGVLYPTLVLATGALTLGEVSKLGGPFERLARFQRGSADSSVGAPQQADEPEEGHHER